MSEMSDTRDRVIRLETEMIAVKTQLTNVNEKLDEIHEIFLQAKGARYMIIILAGIFGFFVSWVPSIISYLLPR